MCDSNRIAHRGCIARFGPLSSPPTLGAANGVASQEAFCILCPLPPQIIPQCKVSRAAQLTAKLFSAKFQEPLESSCPFFLRKGYFPGIFKRGARRLPISINGAFRLLNGPFFPTLIRKGRTWAIAVRRGSYKSLFLLNSGRFSLEKSGNSVLNFGSRKTV